MGLVHSAMPFGIEDGRIMKLYGRRSIRNGNGNGRERERGNIAKEKMGYGKEEIICCEREG